MRAAEFVDELVSRRFEAVFNPYAERCPVHDRPDAPLIRRDNLRAFLAAALDGGVDSVWIGRDLGYRGGRRTGLPLTDEAHLDALGATLGGISFGRATVGPAVAERTAAIVWRMISRLGRPVFLWNVFPFHPHEPNDPLTNRSHTAAERRACEYLIVALVEALAPRRVVAVGGDAHKALTRLGFDCDYVRHPSYGGQSEFIEGVRHLYALPHEDVPILL
ncbi:MAG: uracil-DNA glycosylase [Rhodospirillales bacterium]|nr:uracil-DNA glycosylase [Rhodospirillales bacterium]